MSQPKALITGASGFIGSTLIEELAQHGIAPYALMRRTSSPANLNGLKYERVEGDVSDLESLKRAVQGMDYVFHLAGLTAAPDRETLFACNAAGSARVAEATALANPGLKRFVLVSSLAAGGPTRFGSPRTESDGDAPVSDYGASKLAGEQEALKFKDRLPVTIVRPPMVYGPRDKGVFVVIQSVARRIAPMPSGRKYYSAIHAKDLVRGIVRAALTQGLPSGDVFYLSGDGIYSYEEIVGAIEAGVGRKSFKLKVPMPALSAAAYGLQAVGKITGKTFPLNPDKLNEIRPDHWVCSNEKAKRVLGFVPEYDLSRGMAETVRWYRENRWI